MAAITEMPTKHAVKTVLNEQLHNESLFCCITSAITLAKEYQVRRASALKGMLIDRGFEPALVQEALIEIGKRISVD